MAIETSTVEVVMPAMGDSVSEGTVLEWRKAEGDAIAADETLVEISTDKVDAEVPAPVAGTVAKLHASAGDTVHVGAVLAEIAPANGDGPAPAAAPAEKEAEVVDIVMPQMGESVSEGTVLEWSVAVGEGVEADATIVEISTDKVDAEVPAPAAGTLTEILAEPGETVTVGQVIGRLSAGATAPPGRAPAPEPAAAPGPDTDADGAPPDDANVTPVARRVAAAHGIDLASVHGTGPDGRIIKEDVLAAAAADGSGNGAAPARPAARAGDQGRRRDARPLHGRVALGADRDLVPHARGDDARRAPQAAQGGGSQGLLHAPDRVRHRARGHRADAGDGTALRRDRRQAARDRRRRGQPRHRRRRGGKDGGARRWCPSSGTRAGSASPGSSTPFNGADRQARENQLTADDLPGRQRLAHEPGRDRHDRLRAAADEGPGHDRGHRRHRLPARPGRSRRDDRRRAR